MAHYVIYNRATGGVINVIKSSERERDADTRETRNRKRKEDAAQKLDQWKETYLPNADLAIREEKEYGD